MRNKSLSLLAVALLACGLFTTGCVNNSVPLSPEAKSEAGLRRAKRIAEMAAFDAATLMLNEKNNTAENRAVIRGITNDLAGFASLTNAAVADVSGYIAQLPIPQLKTVEGRIIAGSVLLVVDEVFDERYQIDTSRLRPITEAASRGFARALMYAESNPYVAKAPRPPKDINGVTPNIR